jgi:hypothetical protein
LRNGLTRFERGFERLGARGFVDHARARLLHGLQVAVAEFERNVSRQEVQAVDEFLRNHTRDGNHGDAAVVELLQAQHVELFSRLAGAEAERVEVEVARGVAILQQEQLVGLARILPARLHTAGLSERDDRTDREPERRRHLLEVVHRRTGDLRVEQKGRAFDLFANQETNRCEHGHAAVRELSLAVALQRSTVDAIAETEDVEAFRERRGGTDHARLDGVLNGGVVLTLGEDVPGRRGRADGGLGSHHGDESRHCVLCRVVSVTGVDSRANKCRATRRRPRVGGLFVRISRIKRGARGTHRPFMTHQSGAKTMTSRDVITRSKRASGKRQMSCRVMIGRVWVHTQEHEWVHTLKRTRVWMNYDVLGLV